MPEVEYTILVSLDVDAPAKRKWTEFLTPIRASSPEGALEAFWKGAAAAGIRELPEDEIAALVFAAVSRFTVRKREVEYIERYRFRPQADEEQAELGESAQ